MMITTIMNNIFNKPEDIVLELIRINREIETIKDDQFLLTKFKRRRDNLLIDLQLKLEQLKDFDNWKEWKHL